MSLPKHKYIRSPAITQSARDEFCALCGVKDGTTVFCHLNESWAGKGKSIKADDIAGFYGCLKCHLRYDVQSVNGSKYPLEVEDVLRAMYRTWYRLWQKGIIKIKDCKP